jgi:hypothetical protein
MSPDVIEELTRQYTGKRVVVDARRPELTRFAQVPGRVVAINWNGRALVEFDGADPSWHDIAPEFLKVESSS